MTDSQEHLDLLTPIDQQGGIREVLTIALPMVVSFGCDTLMIFTDRMFLSKLGPIHMAAAMAGGLSNFLLMTFFVGLTGYSTALVAQYLGAGKRKRCPFVTTQAILIAVAAYPIIICSKPLVLLLYQAVDITPDQRGLMIQYLSILIYGSIVGLLRNCMSCYFSGLGRTRVVMATSLTAMIVNVPANYLLIFGNNTLGIPQMGIRGAAIGTIIGGLCGLIVAGCFYFGAKNLRDHDVILSFHFDWDVMKRLLRFGYPSGVEFLVNFLAFNMLIMIFQSHSKATATAVTIMFNWDLVSFVPLIGVGTAVVSLVGRYMGAEKPDIAHKAAISALKMGWFYSTFILILFVTIPHVLVNVFAPGRDASQEDIDVFWNAFLLAVNMIQFASLYVTTDVTLIVFSSALRGAGDTLWAMCASITVHWILVGVLTICLRLIHLPPMTTWIIITSIFMMFSGVFYLRFRGGKWRSIKVIEHEPECEPTPATADSFHETTEL